MSIMLSTKIIWLMILTICENLLNIDLLRQIKLGTYSTGLYDNTPLYDMYVDNYVYMFAIYVMSKMLLISKRDWYVYNGHFLHDRPWTSPWIKSISNELDITCHVFAQQLFGHCDVIANRLWRHQQNLKRTSETRERCVKILVFSVIYGFVMSCKK